MSYAGKKEFGRYRLGYDRDQLWERELQAGMVTRCGFCPEVFHGTVEDGIVWHREHRALEHPGARDRGQAARQRAAKQQQVAA